MEPIKDSRIRKVNTHTLEKMGLSCSKNRRQTTSLGNPSGKVITVTDLHHTTTANKHFLHLQTKIRLGLNMKKQTDELKKSSQFQI